MSDIHPKHEVARIEMAKRLARFFYDNHFGSDFVAIAGDRWWKRVPRTAGEKHTPSPETRALTLDYLKTYEEAGAPRGPSLAEIEDARGTSSWGVPASSTVSDGSPQDQGLPVTDPSDPSEVVATSPAFRGEGQAAPTTTSHGVPNEGASTENQPAVPARPTSRSESVAGNTCPPAGSRLSGTPRGGQVSLPFQVHSETSRLAAHDQNTKDVAKAHRLLVLQTLRELGPLTDDQIADHLGLTTEQVRIRRIGLVHDRYVEQAGRGLSRKGRPCNTWGLTEYAVSA